MNKTVKKIIFVPLIAVGAVVAFVVLFILWLSIVEYRPKPVEKAILSSSEREIETGTPYSLLSWNIGYSGLGKYEDFFMDGGKKIQPDSKNIVLSYLAGIKSVLNENETDIIYLQEIDLNSKRSWHINQFEELKKSTEKEGAFTWNYKCAYVPFPLPAIGKVESGLSILTNFKTVNAERIALPVPFKWPVRLANLKRCILTTKIPVYKDGKETGKFLVLADFHLEAYESGEGKIAQTKKLVDFINKEYAEGNYVIAGGDFNQKFPGSEAFPPYWTDGWLPGQLDASILDEGWSFAFDDSKPTCRSIKDVYVGEKAENHDWQYHVIDGFIISPNVEKLSIQVIDKDFQFADHNPVLMEFSLK